MAYLGEDIGKLGFGCMRLPKNGDEFDIEQFKEMVDLFIEGGFTYFDTAWAYNGSEDAVRQALVERYPRESYQLATKLSAWIGCTCAEDAYAQFETSLEQTQAGYFDFYLLHNLGDTRTHFYDDFKVWDLAQQKKAEGLIKHVGFSCHGTPEELEAILDAHPEAEFVQLQINYADWENPAVQSRACYEVARAHNKPIVIMEPVKGGLLADPPEPVKQVFDEADPTVSYASWALRFAADLDGVITVLSGMSTIEQVRDNVATMRGFTGLTDAERATVEKAREALAAIPIIPCTGCNYCAKVCPQDIGISGSFEAMNYLLLYDNLAKAKSEEAWLVGRQGHKHANECLGCGRCERACPQHIAIRDELKKVAAALLD